MNAPCYQCGNRFPACHDVCEHYKKFVAERRKAKQKRHEYYVKHGLSDSGEYLYGNKLQQTKTKKQK